MEINKTDQKLELVLRRSENIEDAFDLWRVFSNLQAKLHVEFWKRLEKKIESGLSKRKITGWHIQLAPESAPATKDFTQLHLCPSAPAPRPTCKFVVETWLEKKKEDLNLSGSTRMCCGIGFGHPEKLSRKDWESLPEANKLASELQNLGFEGIRKDGWCGWKDLPYHLWSRRESRNSRRVTKWKLT